MTIHGPGGSGKSALAIEIAYRILAKRPAMVFWVPAISQESFELAFRGIGMRLRIPGIADDNADVKKLVKEFLSSEQTNDWLMIIDNADDHKVLMSITNNSSKLAQTSDYLPRSNRGAILYTTRSKRVANASMQSNVLELGVMGETEARQLLTRRVTKQVLLDHETAVDEVLEVTARLPLAIVQAAAFMNINDVSVSDYISLFRRTGEDLGPLHQHSNDPDTYQGFDSTIAKTWHISFDQVRKENKVAANLVSFIACIDSSNIPQTLLPCEASSMQQTKALETLIKYAIIKERLRTPEDPIQTRSFHMHPLIHKASRSACWLDSCDERAAWVDRA